MKGDWLNTYTNPVVIGGVGGSGTRLIAQCLRGLGFFIGHDLNEANDNLWFTLLFKRIEILSSSAKEFDEVVEIFLKGMTGCEAFTKKQVDLINAVASEYREQHSTTWLRQRAQTLLSKRQAIGPGTKWGWKEPNSHIVLNRLKDRFGNMKYIHVVRNGLDMAHSDNQNQLRLWGRHLIHEDFNPGPYYSLQYWCIIHRRVLDIGKSMGANFLFLNFDRFCLSPEQGIKDLCEFLGLEVANTLKLSLLSLIHTPVSMGRFKRYGTSIFAEADIGYVKELGFDTDEGECER